MMSHLLPVPWILILLQGWNNYLTLKLRLQLKHKKQVSRCISSFVLYWKHKLISLRPWSKDFVKDLLLSEACTVKNKVFDMSPALWYAEISLCIFYMLLELCCTRLCVFNVTNMIVAMEKQRNSNNQLSNNTWNSLITTDTSAIFLHFNFTLLMLVILVHNSTARDKSVGFKRCI